MKTHEFTREIQEWGSYGKNEDEPLKFRKIKDISDSHLDNIIPFIENRIGFYGQGVLDVFIKEKQYRILHNISVPEYGTNIVFNLLTKKYILSFDK